MPTFKSYVERDGYYISARLSNVGNVTYQIEPTAEDFVCRLGYVDGDELPWGIVTPLRAAGLVYTNNQGVDGKPEEAPGLDPSRLAELSDAEAKQLLSYLESRGDLPDHITEYIHSQVNNNDSATGSNPKKEQGKTSGFKEDVEETFSAAIRSEFKTEPSVKTDFDMSSAPIKSTSESSQIRYGFCPSHIRVKIGLSDGLDTKQEIVHNIDLNANSVVEKWSIQHPYEDTWVGTAKAYETKINIMRSIEKVCNNRPSIKIKLMKSEDGSITI